MATAILRIVDVIRGRATSRQVAINLLAGVVEPFLMLQYSRGKPNKNADMDDQEREIFAYPAYGIAINQTNVKTGSQSWLCVAEANAHLMLAHGRSR